MRNIGGRRAVPWLFDRMKNQSKSWRTIRNPDLFGWTSGNDNELDDCDYEDADPTELSEASALAIEAEVRELEKTAAVSLLLRACWEAMLVPRLRGQTATMLIYSGSAFPML